MRKKKKKIYKKLTELGTEIKKKLGNYWKKAIVVIGLVALLVYFKNMVVVGWVNGQPIWRSSFNQEVERQAGQQVFDTMTIKALINQEAKKQKIVIPQETVDAEISKIEEIAKQQEMSLDELLTLQGVNKNQLAKEIRLQKIVEQLVDKEVSVSGEEVSKYLADNAKLLPETKDEQELNQLARKQLRQQKISTKIQALIQELQLKAKIINWL